MSRKKKDKKARRVQEHLNEGITPTLFHQQNPPPGELAACGKLVDPQDQTETLIIDRSLVNCPKCLSRPDPTIVVR